MRLLCRATKPGFFQIEDGKPAQTILGPDEAGPGQEFVYGLRSGGVHDVEGFPTWAELREVQEATDDEKRALALHLSLLGGGHEELCEDLVEHAPSADVLHEARTAEKAKQASEANTGLSGDLLAALIRAEVAKATAATADAAAPVETLPETDASGRPIQQVLDEAEEKIAKANARVLEAEAKAAAADERAKKAEAAAAEAKAPPKTSTKKTDAKGGAKAPEATAATT